MSSGRFANRVAIVTGGSNGIGRAVTSALTAERASVLVCDLVDSGFFAADDRVATLVGDVADAEFAEAAVTAAAHRFGRVDILVNDAASYPDGTLLAMTPQQWDRVFRVNVTGSFMMSQAFARHCVATSTGGAIVSISSGSARSPRPGGAAYSASKAALETMSKVFAMELGAHGIRVNVVAPGPILTEHIEAAGPEAQRLAGQSTPMRRMGRADEVADVVLWLCSDRSSFVTGATIPIDGGQQAGSKPPRMYRQGEPMQP